MNIFEILLKLTYKYYRFKNYFREIPVQRNMSKFQCWLHKNMIDYELNNYKKNDYDLRAIVQEMFETPIGRNMVSTVSYGRGKTHVIKKVINRKIWWDQYSSMLDPFLDTIEQYVLPDFGIDFAHEGIRKNKGLTFLHRKLSDVKGQISPQTLAKVRDKIKEESETTQEKLVKIDKDIRECQEILGEEPDNKDIQEKLERLMILKGLAEELKSF